MLFLIDCSLKMLTAVFFWSDPNLLFKNLGKIALIFIADIKGDFDDAHFCGGQELLTVFDPDFIKVLGKSNAGFAFKKFGKVGFGDMQIVREFLKRQFIHIVGMGVFQGLTNQVGISGIDLVEDVFGKMIDDFGHPRA